MPIFSKVAETVEREKPKTVGETLVAAGLFVFTLFAAKKAYNLLEDEIRR